MFSSMLAACGAPSVEDFMDDPDLLAETLKECKAKDSSEKCKNAAIALEKQVLDVFGGLLGKKKIKK